jgi:phosphoglycerate dehydrogenase-like enzyme
VRAVETAIHTESTLTGRNHELRRLVLISEMAQHAGSSLRRLQEAGIVLTERFDLGAAPSAERLAAALTGVWATVAGSENYSRHVLQSASELRVIARCGVGYDAIDLEAASERGIAVVITPDANFESVADFTLALILATLRRLIDAHRTVLSGGWRLDGLSADLYGATVGIVGLGRIGRAVARRLRGFSCRILAVEPYPDLAECRELGVELTTLEDMLSQVDVLTLHVPRTSETASMIGAAELARMKPTAILVNTARGGIVDERALSNALSSHALAGAALDVFEHEPLATDNPLCRCPNVLLSGHISAFTRLAAQRTMDAVVDALLDVAVGRTPAGLVNASDLARRGKSVASDGGRSGRAPE